MPGTSSDERDAGYGSFRARPGKTRGLGHQELKELDRELLVGRVPTP
ncbi:hypothetical protein [Streptomyces sp. NPDC058084]